MTKTAKIVISGILLCALTLPLPLIDYKIIGHVKKRLIPYRITLHSRKKMLFNSHQ